jgi:hypothetical protein
MCEPALIARRAAPRSLTALTPFRAALRIGFFVALAATALAQKNDDRTGVRITFLPPPMEGTLSLGIYDKAGKLVRTLHREAAETDFTIGLNGLITKWDGKDDMGQPMPAGKYFARGYAVGEIRVEGVAIRGNDWITSDDSPRITAMIRFFDDGAVSPATASLVVKLAGGQTGIVRLDEAGKIRAVEKPPPSVIEPEPPELENGDAVRQVVVVGNERFGLRSGKLVQRRADADESWTQIDLPGLADAIAFTPVASPERSVSGFWIIDREEQTYVVKLFTATREFKRRLLIAAGEPSPFAVSSNATATELRLLEAKPGEQRLRILRIISPAKTDDATTTAESESLWEVAAQNAIIESNTFPAVADKLGRAKPFVPEEKIRVRLLPNELFKGAVADLDVQIGIDADGAFFRAADGLPLLQVTDTKNLKWAAMGREGAKLVTILQSDGAVIEEFKASNLANMMAFDAGEYEWSPSPPPAASGN